MKQYFFLNSSCEAHFKRKYCFRNIPVDNKDSISFRKNDIDKSLIHPNQHTMIKLFLLLRNKNILVYTFTTVID